MYLGPEAFGNCMAALSLFAGSSLAGWVHGNIGIWELPRCLHSRNVYVVCCVKVCHVGGISLRKLVLRLLANVTTRFCQESLMRMMMTDADGALDLSSSAVAL